MTAGPISPGTDPPVYQPAWSGFRGASSCPERSSASRSSRVSTPIAGISTDTGWTGAAVGDPAGPAPGIPASGPAPALSDATEGVGAVAMGVAAPLALAQPATAIPDRKSTRLNSSHLGISYAV